jgi:electron transport protein HydN
MNKFVLANPKLCIGCRTCEIACALSHNGERTDNLSQENFFPRLSVVKTFDVTGAVMCRHCEDAPCASACPNGALVRMSDTVQVIQEKCVGCKTCALACPFGAMAIRTFKTPRSVGGKPWGFDYKAQAQKCDLCADRPNGSACVEACPTDALRVMDAQEMQQIRQQRQQKAVVEAV